MNEIIDFHVLLSGLAQHAAQHIEEKQVFLIPPLVGQLPDSFISSTKVLGWQSLEWSLVGG